MKGFLFISLATYEDRFLYAVVNVCYYRDHWKALDQDVYVMEWGFIVAGGVFAVTFTFALRYATGWPLRTISLSIVALLIGARILLGIAPL